MKIIKNPHGFSLVSVLVAIGLTGILALILMSLSDQQAKQQKKAYVDMDINEAMNHVRTIINDPVSCNATFQGLSLGSTFSELRYDYDPNKDSFAEVGLVSDGPKAKKFRTTSLILTEMKILTEEERKAANLPAEDQIIAVRFSFKKPDGTLGGNSFSRILEVPVNLGEGHFTFSQWVKEDVITQCNQLAGHIADTQTGQIVDDNEENYIVPIDTNTYMGYCISTTRRNNPIVLSCRTVK
jgi:hypothetical protein